MFKILRVDMKARTATLTDVPKEYQGLGKSGRAGQCLAQLGIAGIVVENQHQPGKWFKLFISKDKAELSPADDLAGLDNSAVLNKLKASYGPQAGYVSIDQAGQGEWGAVMGAKGLKAIIVDQAGAEKEPLADPEAFKAVSQHPLTPGGRPKSGTDVLTGILSGNGGRLSRDLSAGSWQGAEAGQDRGPRLHNPLLRYLQQPERRIRRQVARVRDGLGLGGRLRPQRPGGHGPH